MVQLQSAQIQRYGKRKQLTVNAPTRFAHNYFVVKSVLASKDAIIDATHSEEWASAFSRRRRRHSRQCEKDS
jgi:hypothetical protein